MVAHIEDSPKPPPNRVTLTLPAVNSAGRCIFAATGAGKAEMMKLLLGEAESDPPLPARYAPLLLFLSPFIFSHCLNVPPGF